MNPPGQPAKAPPPIPCDCQRNRAARRRLMKPGRGRRTPVLRGIPARAEHTRFRIESRAVAGESAQPIGTGDTQSRFRNAAGLRGLSSSLAFLAGAASIAAAAGSASTAGRFAADSPRDYRHGCGESLDNVTGTTTPRALAGPLTAQAYLLLISPHMSSPPVDFPSRSRAARWAGDPESPRLPLSNARAQATA